MLKKLFLAILTLSLLAAGGGGGPEQMVKEMVDRLKSSRNPVVILEYVHWPTAWERLGESDRRQMAVTSAEGLRAYYEQILNDPQAFARREVERAIAGMPPEQQRMATAGMSGMLEDLRQLTDRMRERIRETRYEIGVASVRDERGQVELRSTLDGRTERSLLEVIRVGNRWYLPGTEFAQQPGGRAGPPGG